MFTLEVIGFNIESCIIAQNAGANRVELCDNPADGGTTPSYGFIKAAKEKLQIELFVMIRPRGGDFFYSNEDFNIIKTDVKLCKEIGCDGIVTGLLTQQGKVDKKRCSELVELSYPLSVTFHRAFDRTADPFEALEDIIDLGCERILTSGQKPTATEGIGLISQLIKQANERIIIMPGSGVRSKNVADLARLTGAIEFHTSAKISNKSEMQYINESLKEDQQVVSVDEEEIKNIIKILSKQHQ